MNIVTKYVSLVVCFVFILLGIGLVWGKGAFNINSPFSLPIGLTLIIYGFFRFYRVYQKYF